MWFSLEARTPYLDHELVERTLSLDSSWKIRNGWTKYIQREAMKGILPEKIRLRKSKLGFENPDDDWFRNDYFRKLVTDIINSESFKERKIIDPTKAKNLFLAYQDHLDKKANHSWKIWKLINLELWFREFID
jgi:asparagine synthase (glutamine-hydrolysing)